MTILFGEKANQWQNRMAKKSIFSHFSIAMTFRLKNKG